MAATRNHDARPPGTAIDMLVLHYTGMESAAAALDRLGDPRSRVSAHYLIDEAGTVVPLVDEDRRAWHAGKSWWRGNGDVNGRSLGIELVNPGHEFGYRDFPELQMAALEELGLDILARHPIPPPNVVGHSDVAPGRKRDPGERFDWRRLAAAGIGLWPAGAGDGNPDDVARMLAEYGYPTADVPVAIGAFQRHFRPERIDGVGDAETAGLIAELLCLR